jgi:catechol 2,3-dioxygenase-like lactoylglutathione lyase family enzyme
MAIIGTHLLFHSTEPEALRKVLGDVFGFPSVDAGGGWLIFTAPPAELAVHPTEAASEPANARHQITFMCDDLSATLAELSAKGVATEGEPKAERWGTHITMLLPGGVKAMLYQPRHATAI